MRPALLLVLAALLAGCASPSQPGSGLFAPPERTCGDVIRWHQPGLYDALPEAAAGAGLDVRPLPPEPSLPFSHPDLDARVPGHTLSQVSLEREGLPYVWMHNAAPGEVRIAVQGHWDDPATLDQFRVFLDAVGLGEAPERPAWERALTGGSRERWPPVVTLPAQPDLGGLYERVRGNLTEEGGHGGLGLKGDGWRFDLRMPMRSVYAADARILVDLRDHVSVMGPIREGAPVQATLRRHADEGFALLGLPAAYPPLDPATDRPC